MPTVVQLTSRHQITDNRILHCMAQAAADAGYDSMVMGPAEQDSSFASIRLCACPERSQDKQIPAPLLLFHLLKGALRSKKRLFHIHDPDLLPVALLLKLFVRKVIYDVHDDYEASFKDRLADKKGLRSWFPGLWWSFEHWTARRLDGVIVADRHLAEKFKRCEPIILGNYPRRNFTEKADASREETFNLIYVGGVTEARGVGIALEAVRQIEKENLRFHIIGACRDETLLARLKAEPRVILHGRVPWLELKQHYQRAHLGIALYQPLEGFKYYPGENAVKVLEYMAAGIPVLTSDFPGLTIFVEDQGVGLTVAPDSVEDVRSAILRLMRDDELRNKLGSKGRMLFETEYNWEQHQEKLTHLYQSLIYADKK